MRWIAAAGLSIALLGCLKIEGEVPEVCIHQEKIIFDPSNLVDAELIQDAGFEQLDGLEDLPADSPLAEAKLPDDVEQLIGQRLAIEESFVFDDTQELDFLTGEHFEAEARFSHIRITLIPESGDSFAFVDTFAVLMRPRDRPSELAEVEFVRCANGSCDFQSNEIYQGSASGVDVVPYIQQGALEFVLRFAGTLPTEAWTVDMDACLSARANAQVF